MADSARHETNIQGNVAKLTQVGTVNGNVLIVSEKAINEALPCSFQSQIAKDVTEYIKVIVKSNRFGRKVQFKVPHDMTVSAFIDLVAEILQLPWNKSIDELMISFDFIYSVVFGEKKLPLSQTLRDAGISDGDEVQLSITAIWTDEIERKKQEVGETAYYLITANTLQKFEKAYQARGTLTQSRIKALADSCFAFVDEIGTQ